MNIELGFESGPSNNDLTNLLYGVPILKLCSYTEEYLLRGFHLQPVH